MPKDLLVTIWLYLKEQELKVLHLKRRNYLKVLLSIWIAMRTKQFISRNTETSQQQAIALDYDECLHCFEMTKAWETKFDTYFDGRRELYYEDWPECYTQNMQIAQEYLNVRVGETRSPLKKQAQFPLDITITNYAQLKSQFAGSEWAAYFLSLKDKLNLRGLKSVSILRQEQFIPCVV